MKLFLNITLILLTIFACFAENIYLAFRPPYPQGTASLTFRARQPFSYDQKIALSSKRVQALSHYVPVFNYVPEKVSASRKKMQTLTRQLLSYQVRRKKNIDELIAYINSELGVDVSVNTMSRVLRYRNLKKLLKGILTVEESILQNKIVGDIQKLKGKKTVEIHDPALAAPALTVVEELTSLEAAQLSLQQKVKQLFWQVDESIQDPVLKIAQATLLPNLEYNQKEN
ncbi:MAG: hypothetical protein PVH28_03990, partial [Desulfobacterales bacterium]